MAGFLLVSVNIIKAFELAHGEFARAGECPANSLLVNNFFELVSFNYLRT